MVVAALEGNGDPGWQWNLWGQWGIGLGAINKTGNGTIAVLDSGFDEAEGWDFVSDASISGDGDGRDPNATDPGNTLCGDWHGTKMASIIRGAEPLMRGVAPGATLLSVRVLGQCQEGLASDVADGIVWAVGGSINGLELNPNPASIISMSFVGKGGCPSYLQSAISQARGLGVVLVAAAGNSADNVSNWFPANCEGVISVGASTREGTLASYSNRGFDVAAPGGDGANPVPVMDPFQLTSAMGTSVAAPHVAGVVALTLLEIPIINMRMFQLLSLRSGIIWSEITHNIIATENSSTIHSAGCGCANGYVTGSYGCWKCDILSTARGYWCDGCSFYVPCPQNSYCFGGSNLPISCPNGFYTSSTASSSDSSCLSCPGQWLSPGQYVGAGCTLNWCANTPGSGQYWSGSGGTSDTGCTVSVCNAGNYCPGGNTYPIQCSVGSYCPAGSTAQTQCTAGSYCPNPSTKTTCSAGYACPAGATAQTQCLAGTSAAANASACSNCATGTYATAPGSSSCTPCASCAAGMSIRGCKWHTHVCVTAGSSIG